MNRIIRAAATFSLLSIVIAGFGANAQAQKAAGSRPVPANPNAVTLVRVQKLDPPSARAVILRRPPGQGPENVILVSSATTPPDLSKAIAALMFSRRTQGDRVSREIRAHVTAAALPKSVSRDQKRAGADLSRLRRAGTHQLTGVPRGQAITIRTRSVPPRK